MPVQAWTGLQEAEAPRISRQSEHESDKPVSPTDRLPLPRLLFSIRG
jgi:hypothetical protein